MAVESGVIAVTDDSGLLIEPALLTQAERIHRQLRPKMPEDYVDRMAVVFANGGRMAVGVEAGEVACVAVWRLLEKAEGRRMFVDDLVSDQSARSRGAGRRMLAWLEDKSRTLSCGVLALDSGVQRHAAHRFYFREGMNISAYSFRKIIK